MSPKRDNFSAEIKRVIRDRAGNRCSICDKATSGPLARSDKQFIDGDAAHINSASSNGPRPDPTLTKAQRCSAENGIWACTRHAREIDRDECHYTVTDLRNYKQRREQQAGREQAHQPSHSSVVARDTARLAELSSVTNLTGLFEVFETQPYSYATTSAARDFLRSSEDPSRVLHLASKIVLDAWDTHPELVGILATLLSNNLDHWEPTSTITRALNQRCQRELKSGHWAHVGIVEPLAFALGAKGCRATHSKYLHAAVGSDHWRAADHGRVEGYYATHAVELAAFERHAKDPFRKGLLRANNVARLIHLLSSEVPDLRRPVVHQRAVKLLDKCAIVLRDCGERTILKDVVRQLELSQDTGRPI